MLIYHQKVSSGIYLRAISPSVLITIIRSICSEITLLKVLLFPSRANYLKGIHRMQAVFANRSQASTNISKLMTALLLIEQGSFCLCTQPMRDDVTFCASCCSDLWIESRAAFWKCSIWVEIGGFFCSMPLEIWWMALKNNKAHLLCHFKLCAWFCSSHL